MQPGHEAGLRNKKSQHTLAMVTRAAGFKLFCPYAPSEKRVRVPPVGTHIVSEAFSTLGKGLRAHEYHMAKVRQAEFISS